MIDECTKSLILATSLTLGLSAIASAQNANSVVFDRPDPNTTPYCTVTVPVRLSRLHKDIKNAKVLCGVWYDGASSKKFDLSKVVATGVSTPISLVRGSAGRQSFKGSIAVPLTAKNRQNAKDDKTATYWACDLLFDYKNNDTRPGSARSKKPMAIRAAARTRFRSRVSGKLPGA